MKRIATLILICSIGYSVNAQPLFLDSYPDSLSKRRLRSVMVTEISSYSLGLYFLGEIWYKDKERVPFHFYNDSRGYLQVDKFGHAFGAYHESYAAYYALRWAGLPKKKALIYGGPIGLIFQTPIEIFDGLYKGWGFSWADMIANGFGSVLFMVQEGLFDQQLILMKFSYSPSPYPAYHEILGQTHLERFFLDYNGHSYWFSINLKGLSGWDKVPPWLNIALGYSGNGMIKEFENPSFYKGQPFPYLPRYRQYLLSLDLDLTQIPSRRPWVKKLLKSVNLIKVPFPTIQYDRIDGLKGNFLYF